jgi:hypothetical protein
MRRKLVDILYELLTSQLFIIAAAILLFLLVSALLGPEKVDSVMGQLCA